MSKRAGIRLPTLRFRAKIMLGFAVTLAISTASMGFAYLGFERVSTGVASYRKSVTEADLARNIDRELIFYRSLARYYVVTGKEEDGKAALAAEASVFRACFAEWPRAGPPFGGPTRRRSLHRDLARRPASVPTLGAGLAARSRER